MTDFEISDHMCENSRAALYASIYLTWVAAIILRTALAICTT